MRASGGALVGTKRLSINGNQRVKRERLTDDKMVSFWGLLKMKEIE